MAGLAILIMLWSAVMPLRAMKRFLAARAAPPAGRVLASESAEGWSAAGFPQVAMAEASPLFAPMDKAIETLEQRLLALEKAAIPSKAAALKPTSAKTPVAPLSAQPSGSKAAKSPGLAITVGAGEAIIFLPRDAGLTRFRSIRAFFGQFKKLFRRHPVTGRR